MGLPAAIVGAATSAAGLATLFDAVRRITAGTAAALKDATDVGVVSLTAYTKPLRLCSRVYIDEAIYPDPVVTDVIKTVHTQYAAFVLTALQMNQFVTRDRTVQDMLRVVSTEDNKIHESVVEGLFGPNNPYTTGRRTHDKEAEKIEKENIPSVPTKDEHDKKKAVDDFNKHGRHEKYTRGQNTTGKVVALSGDNHVPAGKLLEITLKNQDNESASVTLNLMIQLAPYKIPQSVAVEFLAKDVLPSMFQRILMWRTGEISFWRDLVAMSDIVERRERLRRMDPTGVVDEMLNKQAKDRARVFGNINTHAAERSRNIANSVLVFSSETVARAKAETGIDITKTDQRNRYFATSFAMIMVVINPLYNQVTFYYNGLDDAATFTFDQMAVGSKGGGGLDLVSVMNAFNQGRSPRF